MNSLARAKTVAKDEDKWGYYIKALFATWREEDRCGDIVYESGFIVKVGI